jgi:DNA polymerase-3 subunit gamma/tau
MEYTVLARRFRPQSFGEVVGQEQISQALRNAISAGRVAHAYLFTGARGVGKTSTARILAKSLNCPSAKDGDPCNECEICQSISVGSDVDVLEIDGASNRGIDEIRTLRANVNVKPMRCRYKIYIIDEVHMLTKEAFNALLKTLEEPPANVKFIFCTTEPQKVPDTILSRCQRFDFGTIATATIKQRLAEIAQAEGVEVAPAALELVARRAAGSMRDSQSLFDQLLAFGGKQVGVDDVHRLLGTAPDDRLIDLTATLIARDRGKALGLLQESLEMGAQLSELTDQLLAYFRDLMVLGAGAGEAPLMAVAEEQRPVLVKQAKQWGLMSIMAALQILAESKARMKGVTYGRILAELALVRIGSLEDLDQLGELVGLLRSGRFPPNAPAGEKPLPLPAATRPAVSTSRGSDSPPTARTAPGRGTRSEAISPQDVATYSPEEPAISSASVPVVPQIPLEVGRENEIWAQVIALLSDMTKSHAKNVASVATSGPNQLVLTFPKSYHLSKSHFDRSPDQLRRIEAAVEQVTGTAVRVLLNLSQAEAAPVAEPETRMTRGEAERRHQEAENDPLVQRALAAFGATLVRVEMGASPVASESS